MRWKLELRPPLSARSMLSPSRRAAGSRARSAARRGPDIDDDEVILLQLDKPLRVAPRLPLSR